MLIKNITNYLAYEKGKKVLNINSDYSGYLTKTKQEKNKGFDLEL
ncbi:hypothetical protein [Staphylococcus hominis]|nr:hypothetical protein [Fusobacterium nucleatum]